MRDHERKEVRHALGEMCLTLMKECRKSLQNCQDLLLHTTIGLAGEDGGEYMRSELEYLATIDETFAESIRASTHDELVSMPRLIGSSDETKRSRAVVQVLSSLRLAGDMRLDFSFLSTALHTALRDSVAAAVQSNSRCSYIPEPLVEYERQRPISIPRTRPTAISSLSNGHRDGGLQSRRSLKRRVSEATHQLSASGLLWQLLRIRQETDAPLNAMIDDSDGTPALSTITEEAYAYGLSLLERANDALDMDERLQLLALEAIALHARQQDKTSSSTLSMHCIPACMR
ncbi:hypothetical protein MRB53_038190 [Persea americana]|nr:hypothetical protein MRB53_038190 [Persea americana]